MFTVQSKEIPSLFMYIILGFFVRASFRTSNLPSPASCPRMRSKSSFRSCTRPMGWFWALPFKTRQKKLTQRQAALSVQPSRRYGMAVFPPKSSRKKQNKRRRQHGTAAPPVAAGGLHTSYLHLSSCFVSIHGCVHVLQVLTCHSTRCLGAQRVQRSRGCVDS